MSGGDAGALAVLSPLAGNVIALADVPDPVFSAGMVGDGVAVVPHAGAGVLTAVAPLDGRVVKVMPHAFIVQHPTGPAVLVHIGIDTVHLKGEGFTVHAAKGDTVEAGDPMVSVDVPFIRSKDLDPCCPVVILDTKLGTVLTSAAGTSVTAAATLFTLPAVVVSG